MLALSLPALLLGLASGVLFSAADYFRKSAPRACPPDVILFYFVLGQIPLLGAWAFWNGQWTVGSGYILPGAVDAALGLGANLLMIVAIRRSALSLMIKLGSLLASRPRNRARAARQQERAHGIARRSAS